MIRRLFFSLWYLLGKPPWDTGVSPPELIEVVEGGLPPGRALDLGCGTGTNVIYLARHGWQATGVDFAASAIRQARRRAKATGVQVDLRVGDVTDLSDLVPPFHLALDMGCFHSLTDAGRQAYARNLARLLAPDALYLLYAFHKERGQPGPGVPEAEVRAFFTPAFRSLKTVRGEGRPSAWYTFQRIDDF